jgi:hypothetical protein
VLQISHLVLQAKKSGKAATPLGVLSDIITNFPV